MRQDIAADLLDPQTAGDRRAAAVFALLTSRTGVFQPSELRDALDQAGCRIDNGAIADATKRLRNIGYPVLYIEPPSPDHGYVLASVSDDHARYAHWLNGRNYSAKLSATRAANQHAANNPDDHDLQVQAIEQQFELIDLGKRLGKTPKEVMAEAEPISA